MKVGGGQLLVTLVGFGGQGQVGQGADWDGGFGAEVVFE